jgi:hypothetical protein
MDAIHDEWLQTWADEPSSIEMLHWLLTIVSLHLSSENLDPAEKLALVESYLDDWTRDELPDPKFAAGMYA